MSRSVIRCVRNAIFTSVAIFLCTQSGGLAAAAPEIGVVTEPACNNEIIVIAGEGLDPQATRIKAYYLGSGKGSFQAESAENAADHAAAIDRPPEVPVTPPTGALDCEVVGGGAGYLQVVMKCSRQSWLKIPAVTALWAGSGADWSRPYVVNRPQAQWLSPARQAPGEVIRIFGRTFSWGQPLPAARAYVRRRGGGPLLALQPAPVHHEDGHVERWCLPAWLPADLPPGEYEVFVHGGHGGDFGWSEPLALTVAVEKPPAGATINVRDLGAKGDGLSDDSEALSAALKQAAGGGTVLLPPGTYAISRSLLIPEQVILRGTAMHQSVITNLEPPSFRPGVTTEAPQTAFHPALVCGMGKFVLQDLTLRFVPATAAALQIGHDNGYVEDVSLYRVRVEARQDFGLSAHNDYANSPVVIFNARRLRMIRCESFGPGGVSCQRKLEDCQFSENTFTTDRRWRGHGFKFWGAEHCIFEDNRLSGDVRGLVMQTHFGVNFQNFIAGNTVERTVLGGNAGETYMVEGADLFLESPVAAATPTTLTTTRWPKQHDEAGMHHKVVGRFVVIARGRGLGQWRRIAALEADSKKLALDRPWRIVPDRTSTVVIMNGLVETVFVNNQEIDCAKGLYLYGAGAINNIIDRHLCDRSMGVTLMTHDERQAADPADHQTAPDFFNLVRDCRVSDGGGVLLAVGGRLPQTDRPDLPWASFGNRVIGNEVLRTGHWSGAQYGDNWRWAGGWSSMLAGISVIPMDLGTLPDTGVDGPHRLIGNVIQNNWVGFSPVGIGLSKRANQTLLYRNYFQSVHAPVVDKGQQTRQVDNVVQEDDVYTPERGPIR
jgi:hypothetical protein